MFEKSSSQPPMKAGSPDDFQTPPEAIFPLIKYLKKDWIIWEPAAGKGNLLKELKRIGFTVTGTDILTGHNFISDAPPVFDCIIV